jgi:hypothetical protein
MSVTITRPRTRIFFLLRLPYHSRPPENYHTSGLPTPFLSLVCPPPHLAASPHYRSPQLRLPPYLPRWRAQGKIQIRVGDVFIHSCSWAGVKDEVLQSLTISMDKIRRWVSGAPYLQIDSWD